MAYIGTINRALLDSATAYYVNGQPITVLNAQGQVVIGAAPPSAPSIIGTIADRVYEVGSGPYTINLSEKISGADSYVVTPANANLSLSGNTLTITPTATLNQTTISIIGRNGGGDSTPLTFALTVNAVAPTVTTPLPDRNLAFGAANVVIPLDDFFAGVASYSVSPAANGATISGRNLVLSAAQVRSLDITVTGTNSTGQSVSDTFLFAVAQTTQAPSVQTPPAITGGTTAADSWTLNIGSATGIPTPGSSRLWRVNDEVQDGQSGGTFSKPGLVEGDQIRGGVHWSNSQGEITVWSDPITVTVQPSITATPPALTAGQQASITFNVLIEAQDLSITQSGSTLTATRVGTTNEWRFTPATTQPVSISATKAGWSPYSAVIENVQPAPPDLAVTPEQTYRIDNMTAATQDFEIIEPVEDAETYAIDATALADGPKPYIDPKYTRDGDVFIIDHGGWASEIGAVQFNFQHLRNGTPIPGATLERYTKQAADEGTTLAGRITAIDGQNETILTLPGMSVAATQLLQGMTYLADYTSPNQGNVTRDIPIDLGIADPGKVIYVAGLRAGNFYDSMSIITDGTEYILNNHLSRGGSVSGVGAILSAAIPKGGAATLRIKYTSNSSGAHHFGIFAVKGMTHFAHMFWGGAATTAGTPMTVKALDTQPDDQVILLALMQPGSDGDFVSGVSGGLTKIFDKRASNRTDMSMWLGAFKETTAAAERIFGVTPSVTGQGVMVMAHLRKSA
ncbi:hypothetical protein [Paracoccus sp. AK26]|uniref:hypothetical protein n=1 Tax=Paracoccus sp. AK26 TaxID=2589076 RepID=UPI0014287D21|nr:hypothetical protein [Paracoccus sp. AK26]QIR84999.1 hypothetical protein FIU66_07145 [Paracoccus sp. AK26]